MSLAINRDGSLVHSTAYSRDDSVIANFGCFSTKMFCNAELRCELVRGRTDSRYEPFEISPETIEQELRPAVCEQRQRHRFKEKYYLSYSFGFPRFLPNILVHFSVVLLCAIGFLVFFNYLLLSQSSKTSSGTKGFFL